MPRRARTVLAGLPHHITQRGNRREQVFFSDDDCSSYLSMLFEYGEKFDVQLLAYCLMPNHVHLIAVPAADDSLHRMLRPVHTRHAQRINRSKDWSGHLWQGRYFSSTLDESYLWAAVRYVERNPVRARLERRAENYRWSSAAAHCGKRTDALIDSGSTWGQLFANVKDWSAWLHEGDEPDELQMLRRNGHMGLPCGDERFVQSLEQATGRVLTYRPPGRPNVS